MERKVKHPELIQAVVTRMAGNSFLLKGWSVTLVAALFALAAKDANARFGWIAFLPTLMFWILDGYFLSQERRFRRLFDHVRMLDESKVDFSMDTIPFKTWETSWLAAICSVTLLVFYLSVIVIISVVLTFLK